MTEIKIGTIVQIINPEHHWFPCVLIVDEVKPWGVQAYAVVPTERGGVGAAYIRLANDDFQVVGDARMQILINEEGGYDVGESTNHTIH